MCGSSNQTTNTIFFSALIYIQSCDHNIQVILNFIFILLYITQFSIWPIFIIVLLYDFIILHFMYYSTKHSSPLGICAVSNF